MSLPRGGHVPGWLEHTSLLSSAGPATATRLPPPGGSPTCHQSPGGSHPGLPDSVVEVGVVVSRMVAGGGRVAVVA